VEVLYDKWSGVVVGGIGVKKKMDDVASEMMCLVRQVTVHIQDRVLDGLQGKETTLMVLDAVGGRISRFGKNCGDQCGGG